MPLALSHMGILLGSSVIIWAGLTAGFGLYLQTRCARYLERGTASFFALSQLTYPNAAVIFDAAIAIKCFGVGVSYLIIIGDLMPGVVEAFGPYSETYDFLYDRRFWITAFMSVSCPLTEVEARRLTPMLMLYSSTGLSLYPCATCAGWTLSDIPASSHWSPSGTWLFSCWRISSRAMCLEPASRFESSDGPASFPPSAVSLSPFLHTRATRMYAILNFPLPQQSSADDTPAADVSHLKRAESQLLRPHHRRCGGKHWIGLFGVSPRCHCRVSDLRGQCRGEHRVHVYVTDLGSALGMYADSDPQTPRRRHPRSAKEPSSSSSCSPTLYRSIRAAPPSTPFCDGGRLNPAQRFTTQATHHRRATSPSYPRHPQQQQQQHQHHHQQR